MKYMLVIAISIGGLTFLQAQFATFEAKTLLQEGEQFELIALKSMTWIIGGEIHRYGDAPISVPVNPERVDTMLYQEALDQPWVRILYKAAETKDYVFNVNACCGGFDVRPTTTDKGWSKDLTFRVVGLEASDKLMARHTAAGSLVTTESEIKVKAICHSAMANNIYPFSLVRFATCEENEDNCEHVMCLVFDEDYKYDYYARTEEVLVSGLYMPLGDWGITITHDLETGKTTVE